MFGGGEAGLILTKEHLSGIFGVWRAKTGFKLGIIVKNNKEIRMIETLSLNINFSLA